MANISIDVADNEARQDLQDLEDYVDSAAFDKQSLSVTENGTYTAPAGKAYSPVVVDVPNTYAQSDEGKVVSSGALVSQTTRNVTTNGTYDTTTNNNVVVDVQEQPWEPLEDGYSNFWFELTDDLSITLKFAGSLSQNAVIDWGDGSGEQSLDTLTPTHTYSQEGKYVVKVKGTSQINENFNNLLNRGALKYFELNSEITSIKNSAFLNCVGLMDYSVNGTVTLGTGIFVNCTSLKAYHKINGITKLPDMTLVECFMMSSADLTGLSRLGANSIQRCQNIKTIIIPNSVTRIDAYAFSGDNTLREIHIQATTPPILGNYVFQNIASDYIIYVPVDYGETYKSAAGWSAYADHILEEGQTVTKAMQTNFTQNNQND